MNPEDQLVLFVAYVWLIVLAGFALPSVIAFRRRDPNRWLILAINASVVGWVVALALAVYPMFRADRLKGLDSVDAG
ncbi:superinfection immunity protein [Methylobacterium sp. GC_Met_2]|uniref:superinfection immunity protein n=1 Tax=Methylobacterium sp. GC_Met_2 TaxID=2937376 RepID=UPI00226B8497|nr:superinfection immunity protein [Methylobacterium sp. GC_Met_2]